MHPLFLLCITVAASGSLATPLLNPLSSEVINIVNKANTTWRVRCFTVFIHSLKQLCVQKALIELLFAPQAGPNFQNVDMSYVKGLCGTILKGPRLPEVYVFTVCVRASHMPSR